MSNALKILNCLDEKLEQPTELTLYGRAALQLGYDHPPPEFAQSLDVDVVLWVGQAEDLLQQGNLWTAIKDVNSELAGESLYISHFFEETQVILRPEWKACRVPVKRAWRKLHLFRLADEDLFLSKCMRDDPLDLADARYIWAQAGWSAAEVKQIVRSARVPDVDELREQFARCVRFLMSGA